MVEYTNSAHQQPVDKPKLKEYVTNKRNKSIFFLSVSIFIILMMNAVMPMIEGNSHFTVEAVEMSYQEYQTLHASDSRYSLTWASEKAIEEWREAYVEDMGLPKSDIPTVTLPPTFPVRVNTKFFYQYTFWYVSTITSLGSAVVLFYSLFNYLIIDSKDKYKKFLDLNIEVEKMRDKSLDPVTFEPWMDHVFNFRRKIEQHKANVKFALDVLERRTSYKVKYVFKKYYAEKDPALLPEKLTKKELKYFDKKNKLLSLLDEEYINQYVVNGSVKNFRYIHPMFIYNGVNTVGKTIDSYSLIRSDSERLSKDAGKKITMSLTTTVVFAVLFTVTAVASIGQSPFWIFMNVVSKIAPLLIQIPMAYKYSDDFMDNHLIKNLLNRRSIGLLYLADLHNNVSLEDPLLRFERRKLEEQEIKRLEEMKEGKLKVVKSDA